MTASLHDRVPPLPTSSDQGAQERRRGIMALDRKRRLTNPTYEEGRRRTNSGGFHHPRLYHDAYQMDGPSSPSRGRVPVNASAPTIPDVVDLTGSSPSPQPQTPEQRQRSPVSSRRYAVRDWQPDSEVNECPICKRPFTWMFRRHHCRKCGRVVCNDCSPHRITIPRQFIVHPPGPAVATSPSSPMTSRPDIVDLTAADDDDQTQNRTTLEGGEKVRLCNPCVPDPQPDPFPNYTPLEGGTARHGGPWSTWTTHARASSQLTGSVPTSLGQRPSIPVRVSVLEIVSCYTTTMAC